MYVEVYNNMDGGYSVCLRGQRLSEEQATLNRLRQENEAVYLLTQAVWPNREIALRAKSLIRVALGLPERSQPCPAL